MSGMNHPAEHYLPGVDPRSRSPRAKTAIDAEAEIVRARRGAAFRDAVDASLLLAVDLVVVTWPQARVPFLSRYESVSLLVLANALLVGSLILARKVPVWRARRIAATWCAEERSRFLR